MQDGGAGQAADRMTMACSSCTRGRDAVACDAATPGNGTVTTSGDADAAGDSVAVGAIVGLNIVDITTQGRARLRENVDGGVTDE